MKRIFLICTSVALTILVVFGISAAERRLKRDGNGAPVQAHVGERTTVRNDTYIGTKVYQNISTAGVTSIDIVCTDATLTSKPCKVRPQGQSAYTPIPEGRLVYLPDDSTTYVRLENMSGASSTIIFHTSRM